MNIRIDAKNLCLIAYYDPKAAPGKFEFTFNARFWEELSILEKAKVALRHTRVNDRDRDDLIAYWANTNRINVSDIEVLKRSSKATSAEDKAEEDEALDAILGDKYGYAKGTKADVSNKVVESQPELPSLAMGDTDGATDGLLKPARKGTCKRSRKVEK